MSFFAGIDGGQSGTKAVIGDRAGRILGRGLAGPSDEIGQGPSSTRLRDALHDAIADALRSASLAPDTQFQAIVAGVSGYEDTIYGVAPTLPTRRFTIMHDAPIAHAGALAGDPGVIVIAGTGSVAYGVSAAGESKTTGGWGYLFGDEGSGFWIARTALAVAMVHEDCPGVAKALEFFAQRSLRALARSFYMGSLSRDTIASFARVCIDAARNETPCSCLIGPPKSAALELARLALEGVVDVKEDARIAFVGGLMRDAWFKARVYDETQKHFKDFLTCTITEPKYDPAIGALILAYRAGGIAMHEVSGA